MELRVFAVRLPLTLEETNMGILGKILAGKVAMNAMNRARSADAAAQSGQYIPASSTAPTGLAGTGNAMLNRAGQFYRENPRKVQALGLVAAAMLLTRMGRGR
jgi:hypothetical protein